MLPVNSTFWPTDATPTDDRSLGAVLVDDGRPLLALFAVGLLLAGAFAWFLSRWARPSRTSSRSSD